MIPKERFGADVQTFAAERRHVLTEAEDKLRQSAEYAIVRVGLSGWFEGLLDEMLNIFDLTVRMETDRMTPIVMDMRSEFSREISDALKKTKRSDNREAQLAALLRWSANASVNAGVEAATTADPDERVGLEWVTMADDSVRSSHREMHGTSVPTGQTFEVEGEQLLYPGQPVGDPGIWMNCRCVVRPAMLGEMSASMDTFANASDPEAQGENPTAVIVALPRKGDPLTQVSSGEHPHVTLVYLGSAGPEGVVPELEAVAELIPKLMTDKVSGRATLGEDKADVLLLDATATSIMRGVLLDQPIIDQLYKEADDQFPTWIPHATIGYPDSPALSEELPEEITYDRIAYWRGEEMIEVPFKLGDEIVDETPESVTASGTPDEEATDEEIQTFLAEFEDFDTRVPWHGVLAPEGVPSGDGRQFKTESLRNRELPLPLRWAPEDLGQHKGAKIVARIDRIFRENGLVKAEGYFDVSEDAYEAVRQIANGMLRGVSVDVDDISGAMEVQGDGEDQIIELASARISAATLVAVPAFAEAFVGLGLWADQKEAVTASGEPDEGKYDVAPVKTRDGKGWITDPKPTARITGYWVDGRGAAKIRWGQGGDFARCETQLRKYVKNPQWLAGLCANLHYRALGVWPGQHSSVVASGKEIAPSMSLVASAGSEKISADFFRNPELEGPTAVRVTADGHVFGHVATWGTCHIGFAKACTTPPGSVTDYAFYQTGEVDTDAGPVSVGQITMGGGHAGDRLSAAATLAHYDSTSTAVADVAAGEDAHGIWVSGKMREDLSSAQLHSLRAASLSGDWRRIRGNLEMVAVLAVNVPGFPIPRTSLAASGDHQTSLVASRIVRPEHEIDSIPALVASGNDSIGKLSKVSAARRTFNSLRVSEARKAFEN